MDPPRPLSTFSDGMGRVADLSETPAPRVPVWPDEHPDTMRLLLRLRRVFPWVLPRHDLLVDHLVYAGFSPATAQRAAKDARRGQGQGHEDDHPIPDEQEAVRVGSDIVVDGISLASASELAAHHEHVAKRDRDDQCPVCQGAGTDSHAARLRPHDRLAALAKMGVLTDKLRAPRRRERRAPNRMQREVESWYGDPFKRHGPPSPSHSDRGLARVASS